MDKKKVLKWVKALESGRYKQGREALYSDEKGAGSRGMVEGDYYCCLGVACAVLDNEPFPDGGILIETDYMDNVIEHTQFYSLAVGLGINRLIQNKLVKLNDRGKKNFKYIARWIRKNILGEDIIIDINRKALRERKGK